MHVGSSSSSVLQNWRRLKPYYAQGRSVQLPPLVILGQRARCCLHNQKANMAEEGRSTDSLLYPKTHAKELYCLADKDLEPLSAKEKRNPYVRNGTPMKLYKQSELQEAAVQRWGSLEAMEEEKQKRIARKEHRALERAKSAERDPEEQEMEAEDGSSRPSEGQSVGQAAPFNHEGKLYPLIAERIQKLRSQPATISSSGSYVVYWMRTAVRDHENPALDVARAEAVRRKLPLVIISALLGSHTYPTHRRYKFLLEGLRDVQASFKAKGWTHLLYVEGVSRITDASVQPGWGAVLAAVQGAALVVTEIMPTPPYTTWLQDLSEQAPRQTDVWAVDASCVVPVTILPRPYAKAYAYRSNTANARTERLTNLPYPSKAPEGVLPEALAAVAASMPWESVDLTATGTDLSQLLRQSSAFDASVPGIDHMPGGQKAGYARWAAFRKSGLSQYAARRNNPMLRSGVSRMSAYHHFGMVSPFRIARDATQAGSNGARKFADEFMTWRELSYCFCHHNWRNLESLEVLPAWSQKTLKAHRGDRRELKDLEALERGTTGDDIWDALQHQLYKTGELHNNVRMTWGKALLPWTLDPESALKATCHLNHKYALDGCDPSSYGGILWCYGQFDGPKGSENTPIFGSLRNRPTHLLSRKLNAARFRDLPLEAASAAGAAVAGSDAHEAASKKDIRTLFAQAGHQAVDVPGAAEGMPLSTIEDADGTAARPAEKQSKKRAVPAAGGVRQKTSPAGKSTGKRAEKKQPGIDKFFKRAKT